MPSLRDAGYPAEAVRAYLEELDLPRHDVHFDLDRIRSLSVDVLAGLPDDELAARVGRAARGGVAAARRARPRRGARARRRGAASRRPTVEASRSPDTLERFVELRVSLPEALDRRAGEERDP